MHKECFQCDINQMKKISHFLHLDKQKEELINTTINYLQNCDMSKTNPEIMADIWERIIPLLENNNPYKDIKSYYNQLVLNMENQIQEQFQSLDIALKITIIGNIIDFAAKHSFDENSFKELVFKAKYIDLAIDDSIQLFEQLKEVKTLLYLGDNCGEIVLDKCFIKLLKDYYPHLNVYYGVRGKPIVNDVTMDDAKEVHMEEVAKVISNGDGSLGTVLQRTSPQFQKVFDDADVIICKGQGNYEGLLKNHKTNIFFLFMAKCDLVANALGIDKMSIVCMRNNHKIFQ